MQHIYELAMGAKNTAHLLGLKGRTEKDAALFAIADALNENCESILKANAADMENAAAKGMPPVMTDRLRLTRERIAGMAQGVRKVAALPDPVGETVRGWKLENGLDIAKTRVPLGVVGIIYEARPNVTSDVVALCLKSGNAAVLRGGSEAINSNRAIVTVIKEALASVGFPMESVALIDDTSREAAQYMMTLTGVIDVLVPRGGAGLIRSVVENAKIPVIETGTGNCHVYADLSADLDMAANIIFNAKTSRPSVCNAAETFLVHSGIADRLLPKVHELLRTKQVEIRGDERARTLLPDAAAATEEDYEREFLDYILAVRVVDSIDEAIEHINKYGTHHSDAIVTSDYAAARRFASEVDSACVYVNASTRFTDGEVFGFGAEIGISTQKLHARGPMGLTELTTFKYIITGSGQVR